MVRGSRSGAPTCGSVDVCVDKLLEGGAKREKGLAELVPLLEGFVPMEKIEEVYFTAFEGCSKVLESGSAGKAPLAYRAIGLLALNVGDSAACSKEILEKTLPHVSNHLRRSADRATLVSALDYLAAVTFAAARRAEEAEPSIKEIWHVIGRARAGRSNAVLAAALSAWALLLPTLGDVRTYACAFKEAMIPLHDLAELLETDDPAVARAAGHALAVCLELNLTAHASADDMEAIETAVSVLAADAAAQPEQTDLFERIAVNMERRGCKEEDSVQTSSRSGRSVLKVSPWARMVQLNFLKRFLRGAGFQKHVQNNPLLREDSSATDDEDEEQTDQRRLRTEKQRTAARRRDRDIRSENMSSFD